MLAALAWLAGGAEAGARPAPLAGDVQRARQIAERADNLRELRDPLLRRSAQRRIDAMLGHLRATGVHVPQVPIRLDSSREYELLREAGRLLRGAPRGSDADALRRRVVQRAWSLHRSTLRLPHEMQGYTHTAGGGLELVINVDNPFWSRPTELLAVLAHELRHVADVRTSRRLEGKVRRLHAAPPSVERDRKHRRIVGVIGTLRDVPDAETRAFTAQAAALGRAGLPLSGKWWRAPRESQLDRLYPPARLNRALLRGYLRGVAQQLGAELRAAAPADAALARQYLAGYRAVLVSQAVAYHRCRRADARQDPTAIARYHAAAAAQLASPEAQPGAPITTAAAACAAGRAAAYRGVAPHAGARALLGEASAASR